LKDSVQKNILLLDNKMTSDLPGQYDKFADSASQKFLDGKNSWWSVA